MRILQIYYEPIPSGQTAHVVSLSKGLVLRGHDVTVVLPDLLQSVAHEYRDGGVEVISLPMRKLFWPVKSVATFVNLIRLQKYDLVHVHSQEAGVIARGLVYLGGTRRVFYTPQTVDIRVSRWQNVYILLEYIMARLTEQIFSVCQVDADRMVSWGIPEEKVSVIPNGIELSIFNNLEDRYATCRRLGLNPDYPVIMQVGRLNPQKDPEMFLHGARRVLRICPNAQLVWIGEGPLFNHVQSVVKALGLQNNIHLLGRIDQAYRCMVAADVVTLTSRWEGLPYSILEAMACSKPVVSTAVNGCPEVVLNSKTGFLVDVGDASGWADRVLQLLANPQLAKSMGSAGRQHVEENFSLSKMLSQVEQSYIGKGQVKQ